MSPVVADAWERYCGLIVFHDRPTELGATAYIDTYHIDGDDALALFESVLRQHGVEQTVRPTWWDRRF
jgi:hypothetical protein